MYLKIAFAVAIMATTLGAANATNWKVTYDRWGIPSNIPQAPEAAACFSGNKAACEHWRARSCQADGNPAACDYNEAQKQKDPTAWCSQRYGDNAPAYRFCANGSPNR
jgi:hypothetical protein